MHCASYDVTSGSEIMPYIKIGLQILVTLCNQANYNVMHMAKNLDFYAKNTISKIFFVK